MRKKIILPFAFYALTGLCLSLASCSKPAERKPSITIVNGDLITVAVGQKVKLQYWAENVEGPIYHSFYCSSQAVFIEDYWIVGRKAGVAELVVYSEDAWDFATIHVLDQNMSPYAEGWGLFALRKVCRVGERIPLIPIIGEVRWRYLTEYIEPILFSDPSVASLEYRTLVAKAPGEVRFAGKLWGHVSDIQTLTVLPAL